jgi:hypothetical protein
MNWWDSLTKQAGNAWAAILNVSGIVSGALTAEWRFTASMVKGALFQLTHPINTVEQQAAILAGLFTGNVTAVHNAVNRLEGWTHATITRPARTHVNSLYNKLLGIIMANVHRLWKRIDQVNAATRHWVISVVLRERAARIRADHQLHAYAHTQAVWALQTVQREAASAYQGSYNDRRSVASKVLSAIVARNPLVRGLVSRVVTVLLDVAGAENPLARLAAGFILNKIVSGLGVDKALGDLASTLLRPLLAGGPPKDLHGVIMDLAARVGGLEAQWATFMADGGPQVEQAGTEWKTITGLAEDAALLAFAVAGVTDPAGTARTLSAIIRPVGTATIESMSNVLAGR